MKCIPNPFSILCIIRKLLKLRLVYCVVALGFGVVMIALTFVAAQLGGVLQVGVGNTL